MLAGEFDYFLGSLDGDHFVAKRLDSAANQLKLMAESSTTKIVARLGGGGAGSPGEACASRRSLERCSGGRKASICLTNVSGLIGFGMYPSNPAIRTLSRSPTMAKAVTATTGTFCKRERDLTCRPTW